MTSWDPTIVAMCKAIEPVGQSKSDFEIFSGLARRLNAVQSFTEGRTEECRVPRAPHVVGTQGVVG
jgi:nitrate reductase alpha subunit